MNLNSDKSCTITRIHLSKNCRTIMYIGEKTHNFEREVILISLLIKSKIQSKIQPGCYSVPHIMRTETSNNVITHPPIPAP